MTIDPTLTPAACRETLEWGDAVVRAAITPRDIETLIAELWTVKSGPWVLTRYQMRSLAGHAAVALAHQHAEIADLTAKLAECVALVREHGRSAAPPTPPQEGE